MSDSRDLNNSTLAGTFADKGEDFGSTMWILGIGARETGQEVAT